MHPGMEKLGLWQGTVQLLSIGNVVGERAHDRQIEHGSHHPALKISLIKSLPTNRNCAWLTLLGSSLRCT